jgi:hypothetical protein
MAGAYKYKSICPTTTLTVFCQYSKYGSVIVITLVRSGDHKNLKHFTPATIIPEHEHI